MDIGKSFAFVFDDEQWVTKILIAAAIFAVGLLFSWVLAIPIILAFALLGGYSVEITRRVINQHPEVLPDWENWGALLGDGFKVILIGIVYALPMIVLSLCLGVPMGMFAEDAEGISSLLGLVLGCLNFLWSIVLSILLPAAIAHFVAKDRLGAAFAFGEVLGLVRDNFSTYLITLVMSWIASLVGSLGSIVCGVGALATVPYSYMVIGHLYGQAYLQATKQPVAPLYEEVV